MSHSSGAGLSGKGQVSGNAQPENKQIGAYLRSREGKRWRTEDTRAILARAAEIDRIMERLLMLAGIPVAGSSDSELRDAAFQFATTAHVS